MTNISTKLVRDAAYVHEPQNLFEKATRPYDNTILLESAEINSKAGTKSLLVASAANRITCLGKTVFSQALSKNGLNVNKSLAKALEGKARISEQGFTLTAEFPEQPEGIDEDSRLKAVSVFDALRSVLNNVPCDQGKENILLAGCFAYDLVCAFEKLPKVGVSPNDCPDFCFYLAETVVNIDHINKTAVVSGITFTGDNDDSARISAKVAEIEKLCAETAAENIAPRPANGSISGQIVPDISDDKFCGIVEQLKGNIRRGDIFQVVPSRTFAVQCPDTLAAYRTLKKTNPSPYMFYMNDESFTVFGASPESSVKFTKKTNEVEMYPIAGTRKRGFAQDGSIDLDLDGRMELSMRLDRKETAEHLMLVDLARNDIARISIPGTRHVKDLMKVDRYSHVMHLVSRVVGNLRDDLDALHAYQACLNMGTLTGAPKIKATELIRNCEKQRRGSYGGAIGYLSGTGDMDTCIVIRSAFVKNGTAYVQAGAGIVFDSVPQSEADETRNKAAAVLNAIAIAHGTTLKELSK